MDKKYSLYFFPMSFFSQKGRFCLEEKGVPYDEVYLALHFGATYEPWYMRINAKGQVPVLQHGDKNYITDSLKIAEYLDKEIEHPRLIPDVSSAEGQLVQKFCDLCQSIEIEVVTYYSLRHGQSNGLLMWLLSKVIAIASSASPSKKGDFFTKLAEKHPDLKDVYLAKQEMRNKMFGRTQNKEIFDEQLVKIKHVFDVMEFQLKKNANEGKAHQWLCCSGFTLADIEVALLIRRLQLVHLDQQTWNNGNYSFIQRYHQRLLEKNSYKKVCMFPTYKVLLWYSSLMLKKVMKKLAVFTVVSAAIGGAGYFVYQRLQ